MLTRNPFAEQEPIQVSVSYSKRTKCSKHIQKDILDSRSPQFGHAMTCLELSEELLSLHLAPLWISRVVAPRQPRITHLDARAISVHRELVQERQSHLFYLVPVDPVIKDLSAVGEQRAEHSSMTHLRIRPTTRARYTSGAQAFNETMVRGFLQAKSNVLPGLTQRTATLMQTCQNSTLRTQERGVDHNEEWQICSWDATR